MKNRPKISIIIPLHDFKNWSRFRNDFKTYEQLHYKDFEIILVSDKKLDRNFPNARIIYTGQKKTGPAEKRDLAIKIAKGEICAFIDDDAYPDRDWLKNAVKYFKDEEIGAVGGPGITPPGDNFWQKVGGFVYESIFCSGAVRHRFYPGQKRWVRDWPGYNLLIRTNLLRKIKGWDSKFYGGEDTKVCLAIIQAGKKIIYVPKVLVYHHRRALFLQHLRQIKNVGIHRGFFVKAYSETSLAPIYFIPSVLTLGFSSLLFLSFFSKEIRILFILLFLVFFLMGFFSVVKRAGIIMAFFATIGIIATHITYGIFFVRGLTLKRLER